MKENLDSEDVFEFITCFFLKFENNFEIFFNGSFFKGGKPKTEHPENNEDLSDQQKTDSEELRNVQHFLLNCRQWSPPITSSTVYSVNS